MGVFRLYDGQSEIFVYRHGCRAWAIDGIRSRMKDRLRRGGLKRLRRLHGTVSIHSHASALRGFKRTRRELGLSRSLRIKKESGNCIIYIPNRLIACPGLTNYLLGLAAYASDFPRDGDTYPYAQPPNDDAARRYYKDLTISQAPARYAFSLHVSHAQLPVVTHHSVYLSRYTPFFLDVWAGRGGKGGRDLPPLPAERAFGPIEPYPWS